MLYKKKRNGETTFSISDWTLGFLALLLLVTIIYIVPGGGISIIGIKALIGAVELKDWVAIATLALKAYLAFSAKQCKSCKSNS